jgi:hypothetical protein
MPSHATLLGYARKMFAYAGTPIPDDAKIDLTGLSRPVGHYKIRRHIEDIFCTGIAFQQDVGGPFQIRLETIYAACWKLWLDLGAAAERPDFIELLQLFAADPYAAFDVDCVHYTREGAQRIAAQIAQRLIEHRGLYLGAVGRPSAAAIPGIELMHQLYGQYGKDVAVKAIDQLRAMGPRAEIDAELQALLAADGHLTEARDLDPPDTPAGPNATTLGAMVALCVDAAAARPQPPGPAADSTWQRPDDGRDSAALAETLRQRAAAIPSTPKSYQWELEKGALYPLF